MLSSYLDQVPALPASLLLAAAATELSPQVAAELEARVRRLANLIRQRRVEFEQRHGVQVDVEPPTRPDEFLRGRYERRTR